MSHVPLRSVVIIGGGLGGLLLAQSLTNSGIHVTVYERDESGISRSQGYQLGLNKDGLAALKTIIHQLSDLLPVLTTKNLDSFALVDENLEVMMKISTLDLVTVNRWMLRDILTQGLDIRWNKRFVRYEENASHVIAHFEDGSTEVADLLVGADGANSTVRTQRTDKIVYEEISVCNIGGHVPIHDIEMIPRLNCLFERSMVRIFGAEGHSFLAFRFLGRNNEIRACWSLTHGGKFSDLYPINDLVELKERLLDRAKLVHPEVVILISQTNISDLIFSVNMRSSRKLCSNPFGATTRVVLLGDAMHPMTTHAGLGANIAFQDAVDLASALKSQDWWGSLAKYERDAVARGFAAVNKSLSSSMRMTSTSKIGGLFMKFVMRSIGKFM